MKRRGARHPKIGNVLETISSAGEGFAALACAMDVPESGRYRITLYRARGCYFVLVPQLPGCVARGETEVEAVENARHAIRSHAWITHLLAGGRATVELEIKA